MNVLDLFSGIGGFSLGLERAGFHTVAFCETDNYCQQVLNRHWPDVPVHSDIRELNGEQYRGTVDVVCGGFPCQPFSQAGKRAGEDDDRHLWPEMLRVIREVQPTWVIGENVVGLETLGLEQCVSDLESNGFAVQVFDIPACGVGAPHRRHRLWIVAHAQHHAGRWRAEQRQVGHGGSELYGADGPVTDAADRGTRCHGYRPDAQHLQHGYEGDVADTNSPGLRQEQGWSESRRPGTAKSQHDGETQSTANANDARRGKQWREESTGTEHETVECGIGWPTVPPLCEPDDGFPNRVAALRALGNAVVPAIPEQIGRAIQEVEHATTQSRTQAEGMAQEEP